MAVFAFNIVPKKKVVISKSVQAMHAEWKELLDEAKLFRYGVSDVPSHRQSRPLSHQGIICACVFAVFVMHARCFQ